MYIILYNYYILRIPSSVMLYMYAITSTGKYNTMLILGCLLLLCIQMFYNIMQTIPLSHWEEYRIINRYI